METEAKSYVYVVNVVGKEVCKIGIATNPLVRFWQLQTANYQELKLCGVCMPDAMSGEDVEAALHGMFSDRNMRGEWFNISPAKALEALGEFGPVDVKPKWKRPTSRAAIDPELALANVAHLLGKPRLALVPQTPEVPEQEEMAAVHPGNRQFLARHAKYLAAK